MKLVRNEKEEGVEMGGGGNVVDGLKHLTTAGKKGVFQYFYSTYMYL